MMNESNNLPDLSSNSKKKSYSAMKISRLGSLTDLTQRQQSGPYTDRGSRRLTPGIPDNTPSP
jgi:hypothetical protein